MPGRGLLKPAGDMGREPGGPGRAYWLRCEGFGLDGLEAKQVLGTTPC